MIAVLGMGSWGTALACHLARRGEVSLWGRREDVAKEILATRENRHYLPGVRIPIEKIRPTTDLAGALAGAEFVFFAVPSSATRAVARASAPHIPPGAVLVSLAKGLEASTRKRMSEVIAEEAGAAPRAGAAPGAGRAAVVLSGPSHAEEVARALPTALVAAARPDTPAAAGAARLQEHLHGGTIRIYRSSDVVGVELAGALKNPIAIAAGIAIALGAGDNALGALLTRGLAEIARLGVKLGADPLTFSGLSGVGDLVTTCVSRHSRNRGLGEKVGRGIPLAAALDELGMVAEGAHTVRTALALAGEAGIDLPIHRGVAAVLYEGTPPKTVLAGLLAREAKEEDWGLR